MCLLFWSCAETDIPGFPTGSIVAFILAVPFIQGALFATMNTGTDLARDIQTGFMSRLSLTPMRSVALLAGQLGGTITLGLLQAVVYVAVGLIIGVRFASGPAGLLVLLGFYTLVVLAFGALGLFAALRTGLRRKEVFCLCVLRHDFAALGRAAPCVLSAQVMP